MTLITPKTTVEIVLAAKTKDAQFRPYETTTQKWLFLFSVGSLGIGVFLALVAYAWKHEYVVAGALISVLASSILAMAYQIATVIPEFMKLRNIERAISSQLLSEFNNDIDLISQLSQTCEIHHMNFARANFMLMAKQLRERIGLLVGALEKVGFIPLAITAYFTFLKMQKEGLVPFGGIEWVFTAFAFLFILAVRMTGVAQWMEKISEIYEQAIALKSQRES